MRILSRHGAYVRWFCPQTEPSDIRRHKNEWLHRVASVRQRADEVRLNAMIGGRPQLARAGEIRMLPATTSMHDDRAEALDSYIESLPNLLASAYKTARPDWDSGISASMRTATYTLNEVLRCMWLRLATAFPDSHFGNMSPGDYIDDYIKSRYVWHQALTEPKGLGTGGTSARLVVAAQVTHDLEDMVEQSVSALLDSELNDSTGHIRKAWRSNWVAAKAAR